MAGRGKGQLKAFMRRCIDPECGYLHSLEMRKNHPGKIDGEICPSCFEKFSYLDFHSLNWLNGIHFDCSFETDKFKEKDQVMAGIAWANQ
jgi:hypothetical protein